MEPVTLKKRFAPLSWATDRLVGPSTSRVARLTAYRHLEDLGLTWGFPSTLVDTAPDVIIDGQTFYYTFDVFVVVAPGAALTTLILAGWELAD